MSQQQQASGASADAGATGGQSSADAGGTQGGTPSPGAADAANKGTGKTYDEKTFKEVVEKRDALKAERDTLTAQLAETQKQLGELQKAQKAREEAEALQRGEFQKVAEQRGQEITSLTGKLTEKDQAIESLKKSHRDEVAKLRLSTLYTAAGGIDPDIFEKTFAEEAIKTEKVKVVDDGKKLEGAEAFIVEIRKTKPHLFRGGGSTEGSSASVPGGTGRTAPVKDPYRVNPEGKRPSLMRPKIGT